MMHLWKNNLNFKYAVISSEATYQRDLIIVMVL